MDRELLIVLVMLMLLIFQGVVIHHCLPRNHLVLPLFLMLRELINKNFYLILITIHKLIKIGTLEHGNKTPQVNKIV